MMTNETLEKVKTWEQHFQSVVMAVLTAALLFAGKGLWDANAVQASMLTEIRHLTAQVAKLEGAVNSSNMLFVTRGEFAVHEQRIQGIEASRIREGRSR